MADLERSKRFFRGGSFLRRDDIVKLFADLFNLLSYKHVKLSSSSEPTDRSYTTNGAFWEDAQRKQHFQSMRVQLQSFHLMEWIPLVPGRYFLPAAVDARRNASYNYDTQLREYKPNGKEEMIRGGIGSVRLGAKHVASTTLYFLGASSTGISHQGIPVVFDEAMYHHAMQVIHQSGGCLVNLAGALQMLAPITQVSDSASLPFEYEREFPYYCLVAKDIEILRPSDSAELLATVAITFPQSISTTSLKKAWSYSSFSPGSTYKTLEASVSWLASYAQRHSGMDRPPILSDFDEHYRHFDNPVEFPLRDLFGGDIDARNLEEYQRLYDFRLNTRRPYKPGAIMTQTSESASIEAGRSSYIAADVFLSYAHEDEQLLSEFRKQLKALERQGYIHVWHDRDVRAGTEWEREINEHLNTSHLILLLVSPDFMNSDYCYSFEMKRAMERYERGEALVIPILLRPVYWEEAPFAKLQVLPTNARPITDSHWYNLDSALFHVAQSIRRIIEEITAHPLKRPPVVPIRRSNYTESRTALPIVPEALVLLRTIIRPEKERLTSIALSPDGRLLASGDIEGTIMLWNVSTGQLLHTLKEPAGRVNFLRMSLDGQTMVSGSRDGTVKVWNTTTGQLLCDLEGHRNFSESCIDVTRDGKVLARMGTDGAVWLWDLSLARQLHRACNDSDKVDVFALSPYGDIFASQSRQEPEVVKLWNVHTRELYGSLVHPGSVSSLTMSSNGQLLATNTNIPDGIRVWNLYTSQLLHTLRQDRMWMNSFTFSPDGQFLAISESGAKQMVRIWSLQTEQPVRTLVENQDYSSHSCVFSLEGLFCIYEDSYNRQGEITIWGPISAKTGMTYFC